MTDQQVQEGVPEPSMFMELEPEGRLVVSHMTLRESLSQDTEGDVVLMDSKSAEECEASIAEVARREFAASDGSEPVTDGSAVSSPSVGSTTGVTSSSDAAQFQRQKSVNPPGGSKKRVPRKRTSVMTSTTPPNVSSTQGKRRRKSSSTLTASSANGASPTSSLSSLLLADSTSSKVSREIPVLPPLPLMQSPPTRPSIIRYANSSAVDSSSEQSSTKSAYSPMHTMQPFPGTVTTSNSCHQKMTSMSMARSTIIGRNGMFNQYNLVTRRSSDRAIASWSSTTVMNGPRYNLNHFRPGPGFIELGALVRSRLAASIQANSNGNKPSNQFHHIQVGHRQGTPSQQLPVFPTPPPLLQQFDRNPTIYSCPQSFGYVTVPVNHDNPKTDRTIRCFGCQDVLNRFKIPCRAGRRHVARVFKPETFYCKFCLNRKFAKQEHYEYC